VVPARSAYAAMASRPGALAAFRVALADLGGKRTGRLDDLRDEGCEVPRAGARVQDAGAQRLAATEDGTGDEGPAPRLNRLGQRAVERLEAGRERSDGAILCSGPM